MMSKANNNAESRVRDRRSSCPVAFTLDIIGDRWTLLVIRDLALGRSRFKEFAASPEGIPTNILSDRLERLLRQEIIVQVPAMDGSKRLAYQLTPKGTTLFPMLRAMNDWGLKWGPGPPAGFHLCNHDEAAPPPTVPTPSPARMTGNL